MNHGVVGVLLAAGQSRRFGDNKLHHEIEPGIPLGLYAARNLMAVLPESVAVVRPDDRVLPPLFEHIGLRIVVNPLAHEGIGTSLAAGVAASADGRGWVIALADMPYIQRSTYQQVVEALTSTDKIVAPRYGEQRGHPVGFPKRFGTTLQRLQGDHGAREIISMNSLQLSLFDVNDEAVTKDIDEPADLAQL